MLPAISAVVVAALALVLRHPADIRAGSTKDAVTRAAPAPAAATSGGAAAVLADLVSHFPSLIPQLEQRADFTAQVTAIAGQQLAGWSPTAAVAVPTGLNPVEREAWLARAARPGAGLDLRLFLPDRFDATSVVQSGALALEQTPIGAQLARGQLVEGKLVYPDAYPATDVVIVVRPFGVEEFLLLHGSDAPTRYTTSLKAARGAVPIRSVIPDRCALLVTDEAGHQARIDAPYVIDANGRRSTAAARWQVAQRDPGSYAVTLAIDPHGLAYPVVVDPSWTVFGAAGWLTVARQQHSATMLVDGTVLVAGGSDPDDNLLATSEIYTPSSHTWVVTAGHMAIARSQHTATLLKDGTVLVAGGMANGDPPTSELYDPTTQTWSTITSAMNDLRYQHTATLLPDGTVLAAGGYALGGSSPMASCEIYDPQAETWTATASMADARGGYTATLLASGQVLVAGGYTTGSAELSRCEIYDPAAHTWTATGSMTVQRYQHTATLLGNGAVLVAGGYNSTSQHLATSELFSPATNAWAATTGQLALERSNHTATLLADGTVLVAGGFNNSNGYAVDSEVYHPASQTWTLTAGSPVEFRFNHTATLLADGTVLMTGGAGNNADDMFGATFPALSRGELYTPSSGTWTAAGTMATARQQHTATLLNDGTVLVAGGMTYDTVQAISASEIYDPSTRGWTATAGHLAFARLGHTATLLADGTVLVAGGTLGTGGSEYSQANSEIYHPGTRTWSTSTGTLTTGRYGHTATLLADGTVLVAGGLLKPGNVPITSSEIYHPGTQTWTTSTHVLTTGRYSHTATLLNDGTVLVAGGYQTNPLASCELYAPTAQTWTVTTGSMTVNRANHTATLLADGTVLAAGGTSTGSDVLASSELYAPATQTWTATTGALVIPRTSHTATLLADGRVLVSGSIGSIGVPIPDCEIYSPATGTWSATAALNLARFYHTATLLADGTVLVAGGFRASKEADATHESYDPAGTLSVLATTVTYTGNPHPVPPQAGGFTTTSATVTYQAYTKDPAAGGVLTGSASATAPTDAGWYQVVATPTASIISATATALLTINRAQLTVSAVSQSVLSGNPPAALTASYGAFQGADTSAVISGTPLLSTTATAASPVGSYPITVDVSGMSAQNYTFIAVAGTILVVAPPPAPTTSSGSGSGRCGHGNGVAAWFGLIAAGLLMVIRQGRRREPSSSPRP